nr:RagB/SusD family nutrient uptake outer membrane protein [uncultured Carboxylicivirga sp.]
MKRIYLYMLFAPFLFLFSGCEDMLNTEPEGDTVTTDQKEEVVALDPAKAAASVNGIFAQFSQYMPNESALGASRHNDFGYPSVMMFTDANGVDLVQEDNGYNWSGNNLDYTDRIFTSSECQIIWNDMYAIIRNCNSVISTIDSETEDATLQYYLAQGLATRAFSYWVLAQLYQFNYVGHENDPCVPIVTDENMSTVLAEGVVRSTVQQVYDLVLSDISSSIELLQGASEGGVKRADKRYVSLGVAYGIRARVNLTMHNYSAAAADATSAIASSTAAPASIDDVSKPAFWTVNEDNWMWGIIISETDGVVTSGIVNWISHMGSLNYGYAWYSGGRQINKLLYNTIEESDVRKGWWLDQYGESDNLSSEYMAVITDHGFVPYSQVKFAPYNEEPASSTNANDIPLMRIEEMYLIKAEAEAMSGADGKATLESFVQTYRDPSYTCAFTAPEDIQDEVYRQRRIELWGEGLSWFDIMRLNKDVDRRGAGYPNASMVFNIPAGSDILLWRISEAEIQANPLLAPGDNNPSANVPSPVPDVE